jgi:hypothetical protein
MSEPNVEANEDFTELESQVIRETVLAFVRQGERMAGFVTWLMGAAGGTIVLIASHWVESTNALGKWPVLALVLVALLSLIMGLVARFEIHQALIVADTSQLLQTAVRAARELHRVESDRAMQNLPPALKSIPRSGPNIDLQRVKVAVNRLMPPNFNTGWRLVVWKPIEWLALLLTGRGPRTDDVRAEWHQTAVAAYRVGSALWLTVFQLFLLVLATAIVAGALVWQAHL